MSAKFDFPFCSSKRITAKASIAAIGCLLAACSGQKSPVGTPDVGALATRVAQLEATVTQLQDRQQILEVYRHYTRGLDRADAELMKSSFWPDATIHYQFKDKASTNGINDYFDNTQAAFRSLATHRGHLITNESMDISGDVAHVEVYLTEFTSLKNGRSRIVTGRYLDRLDRRNGEWRISVRLFIPHFFTETDNSILTHWPVTGCAGGTWDRRDPSYQRPLTGKRNPNGGLACDEE